MTFPREYRRVPSALFIIWVLAGAGCHAETPLQIVKGVFDRTDATPGFAVGVVALEDEVVSTATIQSDGRFVLALPPTEGAVIFVSTAFGDLVPLLGPFRICTPGGAVDIGVIFEVGDSPPCNAPPLACDEALENAQSCRAQSDAICTPLVRDIQACHDERDSGCLAESETLAACQSMSMNCDVERMTLNACLERYGCDALAATYFPLCADPCRAELDLVDTHCNDPVPEPCEGAEPPRTDFFYALNAPIPDSIGCEDSLR